MRYYPDVKLLMLSFVMAALATIFVGLAQPANAITANGVLSKACQQDPNLQGCEDKDAAKLEAGGNNAIKRITNAFLFAAGAIAIIFIIIGGIRYITSTGDATRVQKAKDTVLYAVIGLIVAILAIPISAFVIDRVS